MTVEDLPEFLARLNTLAELFDAKLSDAKQQIYFETLCDLRMDRLREGMLAAARFGTFMPKPVELRNHSERSSEERAEQAWLDFRGEMRRLGGWRSGEWSPNDGHAECAIDEMFGGFGRACELEGMTHEMWQARKKEFVRLYTDFDRMEIAEKSGDARRLLGESFQKLLTP